MAVGSVMSISSGDKAMGVGWLAYSLGWIIAGLAEGVAARLTPGGHSRDKILQLTTSKGFD
jgi:hypothetical protein